MRYRRIHAFVRRLVMVCVSIGRCACSTDDEAAAPSCVAAKQSQREAAIAP